MLVISAVHCPAGMAARVAPTEFLAKPFELGDLLSSVKPKFRAKFEGVH